jgi:hypothetical protein
MRLILRIPPEPAVKAAFIGRSACVVDNRLVARACRPSRCRLPLLGLGLLVAGLLPAPVQAREDRDHDRARAAVQAGEVLPLATLLERVQRRHPGQVLEVELERDDGRWIYELKLLQPGGQLLKLEVDAATAQVLQVRRRKADRPSSSP